MKLKDWTTPALLVCLICVASNTRVFSAESVNVTVVTLEGEEKSSKLQGIGADSFVLEQGEAAFKDVAEVRFGGTDSSVAPACTIVLRNGDQLKAAIVSGDDAKLKIKNTALGELDIENNFIHGITFTQKDGPSKDTVEAFLKSAPPKEDLLLLAKGDTLSGFVEKFSDKDLSFSTGGQSTVYPFETLAAFRLAPLKEYKQATDFRATLLLRDGSLLSGKLTGLKEKAVLFNALNDQEWHVDSATLKSIIFLGGKLVYLSSLKPKEVEQKPYVGGMPVVYGWKRDLSACGEKLVIGEKSFTKGIGVHSYCRLVWELEGQYAKVLCDVGMDATALPGSVCSWTIKADGRELASGLAKIGSEAQAVRKELTGVKQLELICDYGPDDDDAGDQMDWANIRLIKP